MSLARAGWALAAEESRFSCFPEGLVTLRRLHACRDGGNSLSHFLDSLASRSGSCPSTARHGRRSGQRASCLARAACGSPSPLCARPAPAWESPRGVGTVDIAHARRIPSLTLWTCLSSNIRLAGG